MEIYLKTWPEVEKYLKKKRTLIFPVGSSEQHGPTGIIGIDFLTAWEIAKAVGEREQIMVASPMPYGMAEHHMAFPGTGSLSPLTYIQVMTELLQSYIEHGFERIIVINGHGGNIAPITSAFSQVLGRHGKTHLELINWWHLPEVTEYEQKVFKDENGFHATCGEISVTMKTHPQAYLKPRAYRHFKTASKTAWPLSATQFRKTFPDGRMGSRTSLASARHGEAIFEKAVSAIQKKLRQKH
jgi:creatinine amidohydrolase